MVDSVALEAGCVPNRGAEEKLPKAEFPNEKDLDELFPNIPGATAGLLLAGATCSSVGGVEVDCGVGLALSWVSTVPNNGFDPPPNTGLLCGTLVVGTAGEELEAPNSGFETPPKN